MIGTASARNRAFLHELGADQVIDYTAERFEDTVRGVDVVLDTVGGETLERSWGVVRRGGVLVTVAGDASAQRAAEYGVRGVDFIVEPNRGQLIEIARLIDSGVVRPVIAEVTPLAQAREAFVRGEPGHTRGKIVLRVE